MNLAYSFGHSYTVAFREEGSCFKPIDDAATDKDGHSNPGVSQSLLSR